MTFDSVAATYDETFGSSPVGRLFRFRLAERVMSVSPPPARVLDIGCGTGEDALWLASQGYDVHGIDASATMIAVANTKRVARRSSATFERLELKDLASRDKRYDIVVSDFGALNCVALSEWSMSVPRLLNPAGRAFLVLMGRRPFPESIRRGFRKTNRGAVADVRVADGTVRVEYPSERSVRSAIGDAAETTRLEGLGCLTPGPAYVGFARRHPLLLGLLAMGEVIARQLPFFRGRGDHTLVELRAR